MSVDVWSSLQRSKAGRRSQPLMRRPDADLDFIETIEPPAKLLYDTTVYIDILRGQFPEAAQFRLRTVDAWHSPVTEAELAVAAGLLDPAHPNTLKIIDEIAASIQKRAIQRTIVPEIGVWREAGVLSGILARLQGYDKNQRRRILNDALLFVSALRHGCTVLTRNQGDFDFMQQLNPAGRVVFYKV